MLSVQQIEDLLKELPTGFIPPSDVFFEKANKELLPEYKKLGVITYVEEDLAVEECIDPLQEIYCHIPGCKLIFSGVADYQIHFNQMHRFVCAECKRSLPTAHLLDLHVSEKHDSYFAARVSRGDSMYACYLEECKELMLTPAQRKEHCIKLHKFPNNFRFDQMNWKSATTKHHKNEGLQLSEGGELEVEMKSAEGMVHPEKPIDKPPKLKNFGFGHSKQKSFFTKSKTKSERAGATLEDMDALKAALDAN